MTSAVASSSVVTPTVGSSAPSAPPVNLQADNKIAIEVTYKVADSGVHTKSLTLDQSLMQDQLYRRSFFQAAEEGNEKTIQSLIHLKHLIKAVDDEGQTPLHLAARRGHHVVCSMLIEAGAKVDERDRERYTPLLRAAREGQVKACEVLVQAKADPRLVLSDGVKCTEVQLRNALLWAIHSGKVELVRMFALLGKDMVQPSLTCWDLVPIMAATKKGSVEMCKILVEAGADPNHLYTHSGDPEAYINQLLQFASLNEEVKNYLTPLIKKPGCCSFM